MKTGLLLILLSAQGCTLIGVGFGVAQKTSRLVPVGFDESINVAIDQLDPDQTYLFRYADGTVLEGRMTSNSRVLTTEGYAPNSMGSLVAIHPEVYEEKDGDRRVLGGLIGLGFDMTLLLMWAPWGY